MSNPPRLNNSESADFLCFSPTTLKLSRVTGTLAGVPAPTYRKLGRKVVYDRAVLEQWVNQFEQQSNTATAIQS